MEKFEKYMSTNDRLILDSVLIDRKINRHPDARDSDFFEIFAAEEILKDFDLSDEQIDSGCVGSGGDGGIDGFYTFCNGDLVTEDFEKPNSRRQSRIEIYIIQAKTSASFGEDTLHKWCTTTRDLFSLENNLGRFDKTYNTGVLSAVSLFRMIHEKTAPSFPEIHFNYIYATKGDSQKIHPNVLRLGEEVKKSVISCFRHATVEVKFLGSAELLSLARRSPSTTQHLTFEESINTSGGCIALVNIAAFDRFVRGESGINKLLFESNVRDYQKTSKVNEEIKKTLIQSGEEDFWWLNNGVTILATRAVQSGKVLTIEDPQIVNGLQTTNEICDYFSKCSPDGEKRRVVVRIIETKNPGSRDRIIKATNSQTSIPPASLRATDKVHRDIEEFLKNNGYYYDRRKNFYKNEGRPADRIISIPFMAQSVMSVALQRPNDARARPSTLINKEEDYKKLFSSDYPLKLYLNSCLITKQVQNFLRSKQELEYKERTNLLFYVATHVASALVKSSKPSIVDIEEMSPLDIQKPQLEDSLKAIQRIYKQHGESDQAAKGKGMIASLKRELFAKLGDNPKHPDLFQFAERRTRNERNSAKDADKNQ